MDFSSLFDGSILRLFFKVMFLILIGLFGVFSVIIFTHVKSLNKIVIIRDITGAPLIRSITIFFLVGSISLFLLALVIL
jgi:hypothetical protein